MKSAHNYSNLMQHNEEMSCAASYRTHKQYQMGRQCKNLRRHPQRYIRLPIWPAPGRPADSWAAVSDRQCSAHDQRLTGLLLPSAAQTETVCRWTWQVLVHMGRHLSRGTP